MEGEAEEILPVELSGRKELTKCRRSAKRARKAGV